MEMSRGVWTAAASVVTATRTTVEGAESRSVTRVVGVVGLCVRGRRCDDARTWLNTRALGTGAGEDGLLSYQLTGVLAAVLSKVVH